MLTKLVRYSKERKTRTNGKYTGGTRNEGSTGRVFFFFLFRTPSRTCVHFTLCQTCVHVGKEYLLEISVKLLSKDVWHLEQYQVTLTHVAKHTFSSLCEDSMRGWSDSSFSSL